MSEQPVSESESSRPSLRAHPVVSLIIGGLIVLAMMVPLGIAVSRGNPSTKAADVSVPYAISGYEFQQTIGGSLLPNQPFSAIFGSDNRVYIADLALGRIFALDGDTGLATDWGDGGRSDWFPVPARLAQASNGDLYALQLQSGVIRRVTNAGSVRDFTIPSGEFAPIPQPTGLTIDPEDRIFVSSAGEQDVQIFTTGGRFVDAWEIDGRNVLDIVATLDARIVVTYMSDEGAGGVMVYNLDGDELADWPLADISPDAAEMQPETLAIGPQGEIAVLLNPAMPDGSPAILWVSPTGQMIGNTPLDEMSLSLVNGYLAPDIDIDDQGRAIVPDPARSQILFVDREAGVVATFSPQNTPDGIVALDAIAAKADNGGVLAIDPIARQLRSFTPDGQLAAVTQLGERSSQPRNTGFLRQHSLVLALPDGGALTISRTPALFQLIDASGEIQPTTWDQTGIETVLAAAVDSQGRILIVDDREANIVQLFSATGESLGPLYEPFSEGAITDLATHDGEIYVLAQPQGSSVIWTLDESGNLDIDPLFLSIREGDSNRVGQALAITPEGEILIVASLVEPGPEFSFLLQRIDPASGEDQTLAQLQTPVTTLPDLAISPDGTLYLANPNMQEIYVYTPTT